MPFKPIFSLERWKVYIFFICILLIGFLFHRDFGVSTDEWMQRVIGQISLRYIANLLEWHTLFPGEPVLSNPADAFLSFMHDRDRTYGIVFELPAEFLIKILNISDSKEIYFFRHGLTFFCFFICLIFFYRLLFLRFNNSWLSLLGCAFLFLSPRIFGDAFYNSKDLVFMSFVVISVYTLAIFLIQPKLTSALWHALTCALAVDTRFLGLLIPAITVIFLAYETYLRKISLFQFLRLGSIFCLSCILLIILFWPWLWSDPIANIHRLIEIFTNLRIGHAEKVDFPILFMGNNISSANVPWYYLPVWIGISTPIPYLFLFLVGTLITLLRAIQRNISNISQQSLILDQLILLLFWLPVLAAMIIKPTFYNGWRHLYFIYPFLIYLATITVQWLWQTSFLSSSLKKSFTVILILFLLVWISATISHWHPYSYIYFNQFAGGWSRNYESDYWGLSYRNPIEKIVRQSAEKRFSIFDFDGSLYVVNFALLSENEQSQFVTNQSESCSDYIVIGSQGPYKQYLDKKEFQLFHELKINDELVNAVFKRINPLLDRPAPQVGEKIEWSNPDMRCFLKKGWSENTENWGVWSQGKRAILNLPLPSSPIKEIVLELRAFVSQTHPIQNITITVDGRSSKSYSLFSFENNKVIVSLDPSAGERSIELSFDIPEPRSPQSVGLSEDHRELGIGLISTTFQ